MRFLVAFSVLISYAPSPLKGALMTLGPGVRRWILQTRNVFLLKLV